ncbi:uncharacterized protein LOC128988040 [Macrosteles quadrilineatus]|uniref:uncharacterized protein LOC128988040 n=1 Tax=Macrosteles quadrilineatus TaxID=74068 RepID=UPI0023E290F0|nr:uncharacterized protein LOC128988040 [Macrosteles quadrilineatus]
MKRQIMNLYLILSVTSIIVVCVRGLGNNSPVGDDDPNVAKAQDMVQLKIQDYYPGAQVLFDTFNTRKQVVNGIRYNLSFDAFWDGTKYNQKKGKLQCTSAVVQKPGKTNLQFVQEYGKTNVINCQ